MFSLVVTPSILPSIFYFFFFFSYMWGMRKKKKVNIKNISYLVNLSMVAGID